MKNVSMQQLKERLDVIKKVIPAGSHIYYFDYPVYNNVGDLLIWKGAEKFFEESNIQVMKRFSYHLVTRRLQEGKKFNIPAKTIIVCQGGGNFGDLYVHHHKMRKLLIENYPLHRIVILPQTIYYQDEKVMYQDFITLSRHNDLHLFVRDDKSYKLAEKFMRNLYLSPDMAHYLYPIKYNNNGQTDTLFFLRVDKEKTEIQEKFSEDTPGAFDWELLLNKIERKILDTIVILHNSSKVNMILPSSLLPKIWGFYSNYITNKAIRFFGIHKLIISSRLHGHILACLMNIDNELIDNSYGKNTSYFDCWTKDVIHTSILSSNRERRLQSEK